MNMQFTLYDVLFLFIATTIGAVFRILYDSATTHLEWKIVIRQRLLPVALYVCIMVILNGKINTKYINLDLSNTQTLIATSIIAGAFISDLVRIFLKIITYKDLPSILLDIILSKFGYTKNTSISTQEEKETEETPPN